MCSRGSVFRENASWSVTGGPGISWQRASGWIRQSRKLTAALGPCCQDRASCARGSSLPAPWSGSEIEKGTVRRQSRLDTCTESIVTHPDLVELFFSDVGFVFSAQSSESTLYFLTGLDILCLAAYHECHILLQWHVAIPTSTYTSQLGDNATGFEYNYTDLLVWL